MKSRFNRFWVFVSAVRNLMYVAAKNYAVLAVALLSASVSLCRADPFPKPPVPNSLPPGFHGKAAGIFTFTSMDRVEGIEWKSYCREGLSGGYKWERIPTWYVVTIPNPTGLLMTIDLNHIGLQGRGHMVKFRVISTTETRDLEIKTVKMDGTSTPITGNDGLKMLDLPQSNYVAGTQSPNGRPQWTDLGKITFSGPRIVIECYRDADGKKTPKKSFQPDDGFPPPPTSGDEH